MKFLILASLLSLSEIGNAIELTKEFQANAHKCSVTECSMAEVQGDLSWMCEQDKIMSIRPGSVKGSIYPREWNPDPYKLFCYCICP